VGLDEEIGKILSKFFGGDQEKCDAWMVTDNPMLGGLSPARMLMLGRGAKLLSWMRQAYSDNFTETQ
jgi:hypothetical protein